MEEKENKKKKSNKRSKETKNKQYKVKASKKPKKEKNLEATTRIRIDNERLNDIDSLDTSFLEGRLTTKKANKIIASDVKLTNKVNSDGTTGVPMLYANIPITGVKEDKAELKRLAIANGVTAAGLIHQWIASAKND